MSAFPPSPWRTRFAPAPTGRLHLGHAVNALWTWGIARAFDGRVVLRIEDHDRIRSRPEYEQGILDDLDWLGLVPDEGTTRGYRRAGPHPLRQSDRGERYARVLERLEAAGLVYPCVCTRRQIRAAGGARPDGRLRYPGTCRERGIDPASTPIRRLCLAPETVRFDDLRLGRREQVPSEQCGDLLLRDRDGNWTYQLAVVVDDLDQGIGVVVRGEDLLDSTGRQIQLRRLLTEARIGPAAGEAASRHLGPPRFLHHPLVRDATGRKLSKTDGDTGLGELRAAGWTPGRVLAEAARLGGVLDPEERLEEASLDGLAARLESRFADRRS